MSHAWGRRLFPASRPHSQWEPSGVYLMQVSKHNQSRAEPLLSGMSFSLYHTIASLFPGGEATPLGIRAKGTFLTFPGCCRELISSHRMTLRELPWLGLQQVNLVLVPRVVQDSAYLCPWKMREKRKKVPELAKIF